MASGTSKKTKTSNFRTSFNRSRAKMWQKKQARQKYHRSFHRSYREDYVRRLEIPGLVSHAAYTFKQIFKHWRTFVPLIILTVVLNVLFVGLMSEETYTEFQNTLDETNLTIAGEEIGSFPKAALLLVSTITTGGLSQEVGDAQGIFAVIIFLVLWLVTIFLLRHYLAGHKPKLRDGLYNAGAPIISTFCVLLVILIELIPIFFLIITYSAAIATNFLATPFYALIYFIFAALMILISCYLVSGSLMALVAVTAPGLYPVAALRSASELMAGRRVRFLIRIFYGVLVLVLCWVLVMIPVILLDMWLKSSIDWLAGWPIVPFFLQIMACFTTIFAAAYFYLYYRRVLAYDQKILQGTHHE